MRTGVPAAARGGGGGGGGGSGGGGGDAAAAGSGGGAGATRRRPSGATVAAATDLEANMMREISRSIPLIDASESVADHASLALRLLVRCFSCSTCHVCSCLAIQSQHLLTPIRTIRFAQYWNKPPSSQPPSHFGLRKGDSRFSIAGCRLLQSLFGAIARSHTTGCSLSCCCISHCHTSLTIP